MENSGTSVPLEDGTGAEMDMESNLESSQLPLEDNYSMSQSQDLQNSQVYGSRSPTGLSVAFPNCKVTEMAANKGGVEEGEVESGKDGRDLLSEAMREVPSSEAEGGKPQSAAASAASASEDVSQYGLEDAQRLIPSQDPVYHELQPSPSLEKSQSLPQQQQVPLDSESPMLISEFRVTHGGEVLPSLSSSRRREELELLESEPGSYVPPNQLALESSSKSGARASPSPRPSPHKRFRAEQDRIFSLRGATLVGPPPGPVAFRITSALGQVNYRSPVLELTKNGESGFLPHDFPWEEPELAVDPDPSPEELGEGRFMSVKEFSSSSTMRTVIRDKMVPFLMLIVDSEGQLYIPSTAFFDLAINRVEVMILTRFPNLRHLFWTSTKWMGCGIVELEAVEGLEEWRVVLSGLILDNGLKAETFPKDSLLMGQDVTALLKENYLTYDISWMNHCLVYRNKQLQGNVRVVCSKQYSPHDITRHAINIDGWQMIYLGGDCVFMESLSRFPVTHRFHVGPSSVILRGGIRKPAFLSEQARAQFTWFKPSATLEPSMSLQPVRENSSEGSALLSSSSSSDPNASVMVKTTGKTTAKQRASAKKQLPDPIPSTSAGLTKTLSEPNMSSVKTELNVKKSSSQKPKNRSARIKARQARVKTCC